MVVYSEPILDVALLSRGSIDLWLICGLFVASSECGSLTLGERHIMVVVKSPREDEALKFYITFDEMVFKGRENPKL